MKSILFIHQSGEMYGSDKVLLHLLRELIDRDAITPLVVIPSDGPLRLELERLGVEVRVADVLKVSRSIFNPVGLLKMVLRLPSAVRAVENIVAGRAIDIVHSNALSVLVGAFFAKKRRLPHVWHIPEIILKPKVVGWMYSVLLAHCANVVIYVSGEARRWMTGIRPSLSRSALVVFNGLPTRELSITGSAVRSALGIQDEKVVITLAGRINRWKGHQLLIDAAKLIHKQRGLADALFVVVGDPSPGLEHLREELMRRVRAEGLTEYFLFLPFTNEIEAIWTASDIAVVPSTEPEPFGMVAIEAMAAGLPVVAAAHGGLIDIVADNETGILFTPMSPKSLAGALIRLIDSAALRVRLGAAGRERQLSKFSVKSQADAINGIYQSLERHFHPSTYHSNGRAP